jgi:hypothetical protein
LRSKASDRGEFREEANAPSGVPLEENFCTLPLPRSASYKLPALSNANPLGDVSPLEINGLTVPLVVILTIRPVPGLPLPSSLTYKLPARSKANPVAPGTGEVLNCVFAPVGVILKTLLAVRSAA